MLTIVHNLVKYSKLNVFKILFLETFQIKLKNSFTLQKKLNNKVYFTLDK